MSCGFRKSVVSITQLWKFPPKKSRQDQAATYTFQLFLLPCPESQLDGARVDL